MIRSNPRYFRFEVNGSKAKPVEAVTLERDQDGQLLVTLRRGRMILRDRLDRDAEDSLHAWLRGHRQGFDRPGLLCAGLGGTLTLRRLAVRVSPKAKRVAADWLGG